MMAEYVLLTVRSALDALLWPVRQMVGYISDAIIDTSLRLGIEAAYSAVVGNLWIVALIAGLILLVVLTFRRI